MKYNMPGVVLQSEGIFSCDIASKSAEGDFSFFVEMDSYEVHSKKTVKGVYSKELGIGFNDVAFEIQKKDKKDAILSCLAEQISYKEEKLFGKKLHVALTSGLIEECSPTFAEFIPTHGELDVEYTPKTALLKAGCKTSLGKESLYVQLQLDHSEEVLGMLKISESLKNPGIKCLFKSDFQVENIQGKIPGLETNLAKKAAAMFWGSVKMDFSLLAKYLPEKQCRTLEGLELNSEVEFEGSWDLEALQFQGALKSKHFDCLGFSFEDLQGALTLSQEECLLENVTLDDPSCHLLIKQALFTHGVEWRCHIPLILVSDFQPSRLKNVSSNQEKIKPFIIKKLSLYNIEGAVGDASSFTARGKLNFTNGLKKEFGILEIPLEAIKNLGLDPGLFTPIYGEVEFEMQDGKFVLIDLVNAYSEGKRSEFYLPEDVNSYLDLKGNLNFDLRMKQNVLLNITEPFTLTVRGHISKPKYSLVRTTD
jgi:hypothetical protein